MTKSLMLLFSTMLMSISLMMMMTMSVNSNNKNTHPIMMGLTLFILLILSSMNLSIYSSSHMYSFILFLIMIGGLMIIFLYFTSFISNMKTSMKWSFLKMIPMKLIMINLFFLMLLNNMSFNLNWYNNFKEINSISTNFMNSQMNLMYMYSIPKNFITMMAMIYLLLVLTFIVKMCISKKFSLRKMN